MSLSVYAYVLDENRAWQLLDPPTPGGELAGFERWRTTVWGSTAVLALGAYYFPVLARGDLTVLPHAVPEFLDECALLRKHLDAIAAQADDSHPREVHTERIAARLTHIEAAAARALEVGGGVLIW
ncbi:hypothetical protein AB0L82_11610 [Nocardia sp. NPDC052001]|uniref:hypothetical protein n=1 Tax=Nocardia sp. NPDC052001 TaxID=3154853 RepID=UPI0034414E7C